jgi:hypothetical protein
MLEDLGRECLNREKEWLEGIVNGGGEEVKEFPVRYRTPDKGLAESSKIINIVEPGHAQYS